MDELEKKDGLPEEAVSDSVASESDSNEKAHKAAEELIEELEGIKNMFQEELDKAMTEESDGGISEELIQELEEYDEETVQEELASEEDLCFCCGEKRRDTSFGDDYPYCNDCRNLMKATPFRFVGVLFVILTMLISGLALGRSMTHVSDYMAILDADDAYASGYVVDAILSYEAYLSSKNVSDVSMKAVKNLAKGFADLGYYSNAVSYIENYFSEAQLKMPWNKKYAAMISDYEMLDKTTSLINTEFSAALGNQEFDYEADVKKLEGFIEENKESNEYSECFLEYAKYLLMMVDKQPNSVQLEQLKRVEAADSDGKFSWIYLNYLIKAYSKEGDSENAALYYEKAIENNRQEMASYVYYADSFRFGEKADADKILEIAEEAQSVCASNSYPEYYKIYAIGYALKGDYEKASENMVNFRRNCQSTRSDYDFAAICALAAEDDEAYKEAKDILESYGYKFSSIVSNFRKGKITVAEILTDKEGEI